MSWLLKITGTNPATWRSDLHRGLGVAAFGAAEPVLRNRPLALDALAVRLRDELAERLPRKHAGAIVRGFFDHWGEGVAYAEHEGQDTVFVTAELDHRAHGDSNWRCAIGPFDTLQAFINDLPKPVRRVLYVHVLEVLADIRRCAAEAGIDLSGGHFFVPPRHPLLVEVKAHWAKWRAEHDVTGTRAKFPKIARERKLDIEKLYNEAA